MDDIHRSVDRLIQKDDDRRIKRWHYILLCIVCLSLGGVLAIPFFQRQGWGIRVQELLVEDLDKNKSDFGEEPLNGSAYNYWYAPENTFGVRQMKFVNFSFWKKWLKKYFWYTLEARPDNQSQWQDANELLNVTLTFNETNDTCKVTLTLNTSNAPKALFYRFTLVANRSIISHINKSTAYQYILNLSANHTENYSICYNYSDLVPYIESGKINIKQDIYNNYFYQRIKTNKKIDVNKTFVIDPSFGYSGESTDYKDTLRGPYLAGNFTFTGTDGSSLYNISFYGDSNSDTCTFEGVIYYGNNLTWIANTSLKASENTGFGVWVWNNLSFETPVTLSNNEVYLLCVGGHQTGSTQRLVRSDEVGEECYDSGYYPNNDEPQPYNKGTTYSDDQYNILGWYTEPSAEDWHQIFTNNFSYSNTTTDLQCFTNNFSYSNTTVIQQVFTNNFSYSNTTVEVQCFTNNFSYSNTTEELQVFTNNFSYSNMATDNFGTTTAYDDYNMSLSSWVGLTKHEHIRGINASPNYNGSANYIMAYVKDVLFPQTATCSLYYTSNGTFIANTDERIINTSGVLTWYQFNFSYPRPKLNNSLTYSISIYGNANDTAHSGNNLYLGAELESDTGFHLDDADYPNFPDPLSGTSVSHRNYSIYCNYSLDFPPDINNPSPSDDAIGVNLSPIFQIDIGDDDGDTMNIIWQYANGTILEDIDAGQSFLAIECHPDDLDIFSAGLFPMTNASGSKVDIVALMNVSECPDPVNRTLAVNFINETYLKPNGGDYHQTGIATPGNPLDNDTIVEWHNQIRGITENLHPDIIIVTTPLGYNQGDIYSSHGLLTQLMSDIWDELSYEPKIYYIVNMDEGIIPTNYTEYVDYPPTEYIDTDVYSEHYGDTYWNETIKIWDAYYNNSGLSMLNESEYASMKENHSRRFYYRIHQWANYSWNTFNTTIDVNDGTYTATNNTWVTDHGTEYWWKIGCNDSISNVSFIYHFTTIDWHQTFTNNFSYSNTTIIQQTFTNNFSYSSTANLQQTFTNNFSYSNTTEDQQVFTNNFSYSNTSVEDWYQTFTNNFSYSNSTVEQQIFTNNFSYSNSDRLWDQTFTNNFSYSNSTPPLAWYQIFTNNFSYSNSTPPLFTITDEYPENQSYIYDLQPTVFFTLTHPSGNLMNYSVYIGNSSTNCTVLLASGVNVTNGTYNCNEYYNATDYNRYFYSVNANDGSEWVNETLYFNCSREGGGGGPSNIGIAVLAMMFSIFGIIAFMMVSSKRR